MGRREDREELQSTWHFYTPRQAGVPFSRKDLEDSKAIAEADAAAARVDAQSNAEPDEDGGSYTQSARVYLPALARVAR